MIRAAALMTVLTISLVVGPARRPEAADARHPYSNIDPRYDAGNDTGDSQVDALNAQQLDENYRGPRYYVGRSPLPVRPPRYALRRVLPPPGYYVAPPIYYPPSGFYYPPPGY